MGHKLLLSDIDEDKLDAVLSLNDNGKTIFFDSLIEQFYSHIEKNSNQYLSMQSH
jgi:hypothetical protein